MIKKLSLLIAKTIGKQQLADDEQIQVYTYALEIVLGSIVKISLLVLISTAFNILYTTLVCTLVFAGMRFFGGGVHLSTYFRCLVGSLMILTILGKASAYDMELQLFLYIYLTTIILGMYSVARWVPSGTEKKIITDKKLRSKQKLKTMLFFLSCSAIALICVYLDIYYAANAITYGLLTAIVLITPFGYMVVKNIDGFLDCIKRNHG